MRTKPIGISAGKPTAKIFKLGEAREITPKQTFTIRRHTTTGKINATAPINIFDDHAIKLSTALIESKLPPIGNWVKLSNSREIRIKCPPKERNAKRAKTRKKLDSVGIFPKFGSIILAIPKPIPPETTCPERITAAVTNWSTKPMNEPTTISLNINTIASKENGEIVGISTC